jgi:hypothetical protein
MTDLITQIWSAMRDAGMPEVMLYLPDGTASRCHWNDTALVGTTRVALLADQDRKIVRIMPILECKGIGVASPKGTDPMGYRPVIKEKLDTAFGAAETPSPSPSHATGSG